MIRKDLEIKLSIIYNEKERINWGTFDKGNDYIGIDVSNDNWLIDKLMKWVNEMWKIYKNTGRTHIINPYSESK